MAYFMLPLISPIILIVVALHAARHPGKRPHGVPRLAEAAAFVAFAFAALSAVLLVVKGPGSTALIGIFGIGLTVQLDAVSAVMLVLVSFVGWIVLRYSKTYMDGEARQGAFTAWMSATLAAVLFLVMSGNLFQLFAAWALTSIGLNRLLLFYPERATAQRAARKKALIARLSEAALAGAAILLVTATGTTDIQTILATAEPTWLVMIVTLLIAIAAVLASAQFPLHGWLTEVMEAPTPVSALLHAGVINAGGFLLIRFAEVMILAPGVMALLV